MRLYISQLRQELTVMARNGEQLLLLVFIPVLVLVFFSRTDFLPIDEQSKVDFLMSGVLALAIMSTAMVSLGIATGFERSYGVLRRLGTTPLGTGRLVAAKVSAVLVIELVQFAILIGVGLWLDWRPTATSLPTILASLFVAVSPEIVSRSVSPRDLLGKYAGIACSSFGYSSLGSKRPPNSCSM
ncbi:MAG: ABC transporter permease, partial [Actinomycetota bacterium]